MTFNPQIGAVGNFKCHMPELIFISTVSFQTPLGMGMYSLQLSSPLLKVLRTLSLDSHHLWDLETSLCNHWPWWINVYWCVTSKIFWFWFWESRLSYKKGEYPWFISDQPPFTGKQMHFSARHWRPWYCLYRVQCHSEKIQASEEEDCLWKRADTSKL